MENLLVTLVLPPVVLWFLATVPLLTPVGEARLLDRLVPPALALAVIANGLVALGIATAFERSYGVLKRLAGAPPPRWVLPAAKATAATLLLVVQVALIVAAASALGWSPAAGVIGAVLGSVPWLLLGMAAFAGLGLLLAGSLRAEAVLGLANALFLGATLVGGIVVPLSSLPPPVAAVASVLPPSLLVTLLAAAADDTSIDPGAALGLLAWAAVFWLAVERTFRAD
jgi:ABC-2 type transport system permease protein